MAARKGQTLRFKQSEVERAIRGTRRMGLVVGRIDIDPRTGKISIMTADKINPTDNDGNPWDQVYADRRQA